MTQTTLRRCVGGVPSSNKHKVDQFLEINFFVVVLEVCLLGFIGTFFVVVLEACLLGFIGTFLLWF